MMSPSMHDPRSVPAPETDERLHPRGPSPAVAGRLSGISASLSALVVLLIFAGAAQAQEPEEMPADSLPDIAPQEFEIVGTLDVSLPALERQPLSGFDFSRVQTDVPRDRRPFVDAAHRRFEYEPTPVFPQTGAQQITRSSVQQRGLIEAAGGLYMSRLLNAYYQAPLSEALRVAGELDYYGLAGHEPFSGEPDLTSARDDLAGRLQAGYTSDALETGIALRGFYASYPLYAEAARTASGAPDREGRGGGIMWHMDIPSATSAFHANVTYDMSRYATDIAGTSEADVFRVERRLGGELAADIEIADRQLTLDARGTASVIDGESAFGNDVVSIDAGGTYEWLGSSTYSLRAGARALYYDVTVRAGGPADGAFVTPSVRFDAYPQSRLHLFAYNQPQITAHSLDGLLQYSPYLTGNTALQPTVELVDAAAGIRYTVDNASLQGRLGWSEHPNHLYFSQIDSGRVAARYDAARILSASVDGSINLPGALSSTLGISYRAGRLTDSDTPIPYYAPLTARGSLSYAFPRGQISVTGRFLASRRIDIASTEEVENYFGMDLSARYRMFDAIGVMAQLRNISFDQLELWQGYPQPPFVALIGLRWHL